MISQTIAGWLLLLTLAGCATSADSHRARLLVPRLPQAIVVDGRLDEPCYAGAPLLDNFVVAGESGKIPQATKAWMFWDPARLVFGFEVTDADIVARPASANERDVDPQDRVEVFLWTGWTTDRYYCLEIAARGAVHDYAARFYRQFDDTWAPSGWRHAVTATSNGYRVEAELSREALSGMGLRLEPGARFRVGLFRADFRSGTPEPDWICWVDAHTPRPDFHVAAAFGEVILSGGQP